MTESPLYSFGHGLSYTNFTYGPATLSQQTISQGKEVTLTIPVQNTGNYDGEEVVQVYLSCPGDKEGPSHTLRAFKRVHIAKDSAQMFLSPSTVKHSNGLIQTPTPCVW